MNPDARLNRENDEWAAAQAELIAKRRALGLDETGRTPGIKTMGEALKAALITIPFRSRDELIETCPSCGAIIKPVEFDVLGTKRLVPGRCEPCSITAMEAEAKRKRDDATAKRIYLYSRAFRQELGLLAGATLENYSVRPGSEQSLRMAQKYATELPDPEWKGLVFHGPPGNGKSHLAAAIMKRAETHDMAVAWVHVPTWLRNLGTMESIDREELIRLASTADMLVMDELGGGKMTASRAEWLLSVLDAVYRHRRLFVATSNLKPGALVEALTPKAEDGSRPDVSDGERIIDRLMEVGVFVENQATSYRAEIARRRLQEGTRNG